MRKLAAILLALPVLAVFYLGRIGSKEITGRIIAGVAAAGVIAVVVVVSLPPAKGAAVRPTVAPTPVSAALLDAVTTGHGLTAPITIAFDKPMDPISVAAALRISPEAPVTFTWSADATSLKISPIGRWTASTLYTVTVAATARSSDGGTLTAPLHATVMTVGGGIAEITATRLSGGKARPDTAFRIVLDRPVTLEALRKAITVSPAIEGSTEAATADNTYIFTPAAPLEPKTTYTVSLTGLVDADGTPFETTPTVTVETSGAPGVVRFRPRNGQTKIERSAALSVRFTERMDRTTTADAFTVTAAGKPVKGKAYWAEAQTVLVFIPDGDLPYGAKVVMTVGAKAQSRAGVAVGRAIAGTFTVVPKPAAKPTKPTKPPTSGGTKPIGHSGGGGAVSGSWTGVESYYLRLMNCTRTGGWVTSHGACSSPGGRNVAPLMLSSSISAQVSRPYARLLATHGLCDHFIGGTPGDRLRRAGFTSYRWGENLGCRSGNPYSAVLGSHLYFQSEKPYNGGHYVNLMNAAYDRAGIGVWVSGGRVRLVVDLYHP